MSGATMVRLRDLGDWSGGNTPSKANVVYWTDGTIPWVSPKDMKVDEINSSEDRVSEAALKEGRVSLVSEGSVLVVTRSGILAHTLPVAVTKTPVTINQDLKALTPKPGVSPKYVAHALRGASQRILKECSKHGTTVASIETNALLDFEIPLVDFDEQRRIVAELEKQFSRLDQAVANLKRAKANLKRYAAAVLGAAVGGGLVPTEAALARVQGRAYESGESLLRRISEARKGQREGKGKFSMPEGLSAAELPSLPDGWVWTTAMQACDVVVDCHNKTAPYVPAGIPLVRTTNIRDGRLLFEDMRYVDQPTYDFWSRRCPPKPGDVLFTREAPMGEAAVIPPGLKICLGQRTMLMRPSAALDKGFLLAALMSPVVRRLIDRVAVGSGVKHLRVGDVERIAVPLPPLAEQNRIVAELDRRLSIVREVEAEVDANLRRAQALRQEVLSRKFHARGEGDR